MRNIYGILSEITCGEGCWSAKDNICVCSCGGKNHGIHRTGEIPQRTAKIQGYKYKLLAVGPRRELYKTAEAINNEQLQHIGKPIKCISYKNGKEKESWIQYTYKWRDTDRGAPARIKHATVSQCQRWGELSKWQESSKTDLYFEDVCLLWERLEKPAPPKEPLLKKTNNKRRKHDENIQITWSKRHNNGRD